MPVTDQDTAWLLGAKSKVFGLNLDYNYRDVQRYAVVGAFTDSDFANGFTGSRGHKFKVGYDIDKNFAIGATYFLTKADFPASVTSVMPTPTPCSWMQKPSSDYCYTTWARTAGRFNSLAWRDRSPSSVRSCNASFLLVQKTHPGSSAGMKPAELPGCDL